MFFLFMRQFEILTSVLPKSGLQECDSTHTGAGLVALERRQLV